MGNSWVFSMTMKHVFMDYSMTSHSSSTTALAFWESSYVLNLVSFCAISMLICLVILLNRSFVSVLSWNICMQSKYSDSASCPSASTSDVRGCEYLVFDLAWSFVSIRVTLLSWYPLTTAWNASGVTQCHTALTYAANYLLFCSSFILNCFRYGINSVTAASTAD